MSRTIQKYLVTVAALGALALGGSALATAASTTTTPAKSGSSGAGSTRQAPQGRHVGSNGKREAALTGDTAAKVKAAAEAKVSGGTVLRVETDVDTGSPYEAHVQKSDGSQVVVYVDSSFNVTSVADFGGPQHP